MMGPISADLAENEGQLAHVLRWPDNLGIQFRRIRLSSHPPADALLVSVDGLYSVKALASQVLQPLAAFSGTPSLAEVTGAIMANQLQATRDSGRVVEAVLDGWVALLAEGWEQALLIDVVDQVQHHAWKLGRDPNSDIFARELRVNVALLRKRLRDPGLRAYRVGLKRPRSGEVALLYLEGKAAPAVVRAVRMWACRHMGEEMVGRDLTQPASAVFGLLPRFNPVRWANKAATLLDSGYVAVLVDGIPYAYTAPVTHASWLLSPSDWILHYPLRRWLVRLRTLMAFLVLVLPGTVVALLNYHQEMVPVGFLLAVASIRENAPFGVFFECLGAEFLVETGREASFRLPLPISAGSVLIATILILLMTVLTGFIGPVPAFTTAVGAVLSLALPSYGGAYMTRVWRYYLLLAAVIMGFFGMAAGLFIMASYLHQARSWGVSFLGPSGWELTAVESASNRRPSVKGGRRGVRKRHLVR